MIRTPIEQFPGLRILALFSAVALTTAFALGHISDASAQAREDELTGATFQLPAEDGRTRVFLAGVASGDREEHVDGSGGREEFSSQVPAKPTPAGLPEDSTDVPAQEATPLAEVPAPAPTPIAPVIEQPAPAPAAYNGACPELIYNALGIAGCKISFCESGWNPNAIGHAGELGWFQIHPRWHSDATLNPAGNVAAAVRISSGGTNWSPWSVRGVLTSGHCPNGTIPPV